MNFDLAAITKLCSTHPPSHPPIWSGFGAAPPFIIYLSTYPFTWPGCRAHCQMLSTRALRSSLSSIRLRKTLTLLRREPDEPLWKHLRFYQKLDVSCGLTSSSEEVTVHFECQVNPGDKKLEHFLCTQANHLLGSWCWWALRLLPPWDGWDALGFLIIIGSASRGFLQWHCPVLLLLCCPQSFMCWSLVTVWWC